MVADRFFPTDRVLGIKHRFGTFNAATFPVTDPTIFVWTLFAYCIVYTPTEAEQFYRLSPPATKFFAYIRIQY